MAMLVVPPPPTSGPRRIGLSMATASPVATLLTTLAIGTRITVPGTPSSANLTGGSDSPQVLTEQILLPSLDLPPPAPPTVVNPLQQDSAPLRHYHHGHIRYPCRR
ncbi:hypothetical protein BDN72DRAFT_92650 [Pluteus cervinus]|uniref:Uncharacterized protein n=1 Tax=Pluteus cervinus TaxID=181527 RepID=A0ACD3APF9_9AGAR|nr:hypothetical protein BDN72DRAFT_92650 [Pluteus cervinus]